METPAGVTEEPIRYWDHVAEQWKGSGEDLLWRRHSDAVNTALLARWLPDEPIHRLLKTDLFDEAVSEGLAPFLRSRADTLVGVDVSMTTIRRAHAQTAIITPARADTRCFPFRSDSFDVVVSNSTLDHFQSFDAVVASLRELRRVLRTGGHLLLTMDNLANPIIALRNGLPFKWLHRLGIVPYYVGVTCGPNRLRRTLQEVGFTVVDTTAIMHSPRVVAVWLARRVQARTAPSFHRKFLRWLMQWEFLERLPARFMTGYFVAVRCVK